uniref:Probable G-protein coupled receptor 34 n=1 Tax=Myripristis murdjan TaxID=586833 RepID=A0A668AQS2_9TELE
MGFSHTVTNFNTTTTTTSQFPNSSLSLVTTKTSWTTLSTTPDPCHLDDSSLQIPLAVFYSLLFVLGLAGNLLALWVFLFVQSKRNSVHVFLINVALADLLLVVCLPFRILYHSRVGNLFYMNMYISITLLGLISVDRYLKTKRDMGMQHRLQTKWSTVTCTVIWVVAFNPCVICTDGLCAGVSRCFHYKHLQSAMWKAYINMFLVVIFWLTFFALVASYWKIAFKLLRTSQEKPDLPNAPRYTRTAKKSFFILFVFTVCFVPYHTVRVFYIMSQITDSDCFWRNVADKANEVALLFSALNSCLDPVMYFLLSSSERCIIMWLTFCTSVQKISGPPVNHSRKTPTSYIKPASSKVALVVVSSSIFDFTLFSQMCGQYF